MNAPNPNRVAAHQPLRRTTWVVEVLTYGRWWVPTCVSCHTRREARAAIAAYDRQGPDDRTTFRVVKYAPAEQASDYAEQIKTLVNRLKIRIEECHNPDPDDDGKSCYCVTDLDLIDAAEVALEVTR
jgi:hypothetical protein